MSEFKDKLCIVTGAAQGIGRAVVERLLEEGCRIAALDMNASGLEEIKSEKVQTFNVDITDFSEVRKIVNELEQESAVDMLVNVAGIYAPGRVIDLDLPSTEKIMAVNFKGAFNLTQSVIQHMIKRKRGSIVTISSNAAKTPRIHMGAYPFSKAALTQYIKCLALELAEFGIRCNLVSPGSTDTPMQRSFQKDFTLENPVITGDSAKFRLGIPLKKIARPEEVASVVRFLLSAESSHMTMEDLTVDGGATLGC